MQEEPWQQQPQRRLRKHRWTMAKKRAQRVHRQAERQEQTCQAVLEYLAAQSESEESPSDYDESNYDGRMVKLRWSSLPQFNLEFQESDPDELHNEDGEYLGHLSELPSPHISQLARYSFQGTGGRASSTRNSRAQCRRLQKMGSCEEKSDFGQATKSLAAGLEPDRNEQAAGPEPDRNEPKHQFVGVSGNCTKTQVAGQEPDKNEPKHQIARGSHSHRREPASGSHSHRREPRRQIATTGSHSQREPKHQIALEGSQIQKEPKRQIESGLHAMD